MADASAEQVATGTLKAGGKPVVATDEGLAGAKAKGESNSAGQENELIPTVGAEQPVVDAKLKDVNVTGEDQGNGGTKTNGSSIVESAEKAQTDAKDNTPEQPGKSTQKKRENKSKFDPSLAEISSDPEEIRKQVEFYFSDSNLPMDKFLFAKVGGVENKPVSIKMIASFKRMQRFQPYEAIVAALKDSIFLDVTGKEEVRRKVPLDPAATGETAREAYTKWEDKTMDRSIYAKGFGEETPTTQFEIEAFFAPYGPTNAIRLRRTLNRTFKGSVFVEFQDTATQQKFITLEPKPRWKGEIELLWKTKKDYVDGKAGDIKSGKIKASGSFQGNRNGLKDGAGKGDWKKRRENDQKSGFRGGRGGNRGRGGRGGRRGSGGRGRDGNRRDGRDKQETDSHQVPQLITSTPDTMPPPNRHVPDSTPAAEGSKKRLRDDGLTTSENIPGNKKPKVEASVALEAGT